MSTIKKNDFIRIDYTGKLKEEGFIFDTTELARAQEAGLETKNRSFEPLVICVGEGQVLPGIERYIEGKEIGNYTFDIAAEDGFGKKDGKLIQLIPAKKFKEQGINPMPGLQVNIDRNIGIIRSVSGGRIIVDFNHPFSGKTLEYDVAIKEIVTDTKEKIGSILLLKYYLKHSGLQITGDKASVTLDVEIPQEAKKEIADDIIRLVPEIADVEIMQAQKEAAQGEAVQKKASQDQDPEQKPADLESQALKQGQKQASAQQEEKQAAPPLKGAKSEGQESLKQKSIKTEEQYH